MRDGWILKDSGRYLRPHKHNVVCITNGVGYNEEQYLTVDRVVPEVKIYKKKFIIVKAHAQISITYAKGTGKLI